MEPANGTSKERRRKKSKNDHHVEADSAFQELDLNMSTSPEASKPSKKGKRKEISPQGEAGSPSTIKKGKSKQPISPSKARQRAKTKDPAAEPLPVGGKCARCREKGIECNEAKPHCNQCLFGLWTCQYLTETPRPIKRSKNGCLNCRRRRRKCTEEKPSCAHCLRVVDGCVYGEYA